MQWHLVEAILRPALIARVASTAAAHRSSFKGTALSTQAFVRALTAYLDDASEDLDDSWANEALAKKVEGFALRRGIRGAHLIKPRNPAIRQLAGCALDGIRQTRQRNRP
jgi:hypothetical protein